MVKAGCGREILTCMFIIDIQMYKQMSEYRENVIHKQGWGEFSAAITKNKVLPFATK